MVQEFESIISSLPSQMRLERPGSTTLGSITESEGSRVDRRASWRQRLIKLHVLEDKFFVRPPQRPLVEEKDRPLPYSEREIESSSTHF